MMKCLRGVSIALFALLILAPVCLAADEPTPAAVAPAAAETTATPAATAHRFGIPGQASLGGGMGISRFLADGDYTHTRDGGGSGRDVWGTRDAAGRFAFAANLRYTVSKRLRWQVSPGFLWTGYKDNSPAPFKTAYFPNDSLKDEYLTLVMPATAQVQLLQRTKNWLYHLGVGGGAYRVWLQQDRRVVQDPISRRLHKGFYPGVTAEIGAERFLSIMQSVSLEFSAASHLVFAERNEQFPAGFNSNVWTAEARFGANYYFTPRVAKKSSTPLLP
jgi:hypothetical protein